MTHAYHSNVGGDTLHNQWGMNGENHPHQGYLRSNCGRYYAVMQADGNFVCYAGPNYQPGAAFWSTNTSQKGVGPYHARMQGDGNFGIWDGNKTCIWRSNSNGKGQAPYRLVMQSDRNLCIYDSNNQCTWASNTYQPY